MSLFRRLALACCCLLPLALGAGAESIAAVELSSLRAADHPGYTRVVLDLSGPAQYRTFTLDNPRRLVIDMEQTVLTTEIRQEMFRGTPIIRARSGARENTVLRLVFDLAEEVDTNVFALNPYLERGDRIVIDLQRAETSRTIDVAQSTTPTLPRAASTQDSPPPPEPQPATKTTAATSSPAAQRSPLELSGTWRHEWAMRSDDLSGQKFESVVQPRLDLDLPRDMRLVAIARLRADAVGDLGPDVYKAENYSSINGPWYNTAYGEISLREFYLDVPRGNSFWRLGKQQVVWGQADGIKVMDVVNPQSFREFILDDFDDSRIPLWMVNAEIAMGVDGSLQLLWIPDTTYHELAEYDTPYAFSSPRLVPQPPGNMPVVILEADKPDDPWSDSDAGLRYSTFLGGWDISLNYLYHYQDFPIPYQDLRVDNSGVAGILAPGYERNHLVGGTLSNVFGPLTLRTELVYNTDTFHMSSNRLARGIGESDEFASVIGLDWQLGSHNTLLSAQWFLSHLFDYDRDILRDQSEHNLSLLYRRDFNNDTWQFEVIALYSPNDEDSLLQFRLSHLLRSNFEIWLGGDFFSGDEYGIFGQYSQEDRILMGMELGF